MPREPKHLPPTLYPLDRDPNKAWYVKYSDPEGERYLKVYGKLLHCTTLEEKLAEGKRIIQEDLGHVSIVPAANEKVKLLGNLEKAFRFQCVGLKPKSVVTYRTYYEAFIVWYRTLWRGTDNTLVGLEYQSYLQVIGLENTTINNYRAALSTLFRKMVKLRQISENPFDHTKKLRERRSTNEWFRREQYHKLKRVIQLQDPQLWLACRLQFYCFLRPGAELLYLQLSDLEISESRIRVRAGIGKSATQDEYVPIPDKMLAELAQFCDKYPSYYYLFGANGQPALHYLSKAVLYRRHKVFLDNLKFPANYTFYSWKNTGAVWMLKAGMQMTYISRLMRHKSLDYTQEYFKSLGFSDIAADINSKYPEL